jgi:hypothetical protein
MKLDATLLWNTSGWIGSAEEGRRVWSRQRPIPELAGGMNRTFLLDWPELCPQRGATDWEKAKLVVKRHQDQGLEVLAVIANTPKWVEPLEALSLLMALVHGLSSRHPGVRFMFGNEFDSNGWTPAETAAFYNAGAVALKNAGHPTRPMLGSIQSIADTGHGNSSLAECLDLIIDEPEVFDVHVYTETTPLGMIERAISRVRKTLDARGFVGTEIWACELGETGAARWPEALYSDWLNASCTKLAAAGVKRTFLWAGDDDQSFGRKNPAELVRIIKAARNHMTAAIPDVPDPFPKWVKLQDEDGFFTLQARATKVRYGCAGKWAPEVTLPPGEYVATHGGPLAAEDPAPGERKWVEAWADGAVENLPPAPPPPAPAPAPVPAPPAPAPAPVEPPSTPPSLELRTVLALEGIHVQLQRIINTLPKV